ncbi:hypothetical protein CDAR_401351 [Caerostris darwini]|uniref:Uncharacterized protein n=1 Tax=Caerostris darwini TaxID=1538125 RepID=A0AAV4THT5_9ARAC|nr:hypothetical protein CDAR_401351 [Caerostris darwini]
MGNVDPKLFIDEGQKRSLMYLRGVSFEDTPKGFSFVKGWTPSPDVRRWSSGHSLSDKISMPSSIETSIAASEWLLHCFLLLRRHVDLCWGR